MTKIPSVEERFVANYLDGDKIQDGQMLSSRECLDAITAELLALLQALHDELEGKKRKGIRWTNNEIATYNVCLQDQKDNLQALMDKIRV